MAETDVLQDTIPVFCTAPIPQDVLNEFFTRGLGAPELQDVDWIAVLVDVPDVSTIKKPTRAPVDQPALYPFQDWSVEEVVKFSREHFDRGQQGIVPDHLVVLDKQTLGDKETCLLVAPKERGQDGEQLVVRADFRSALVLLNLKSMGAGGDGQFESNTGSDGVVRLDDHQ